MIGLLRSILCILQNIGLAVLWAIAKGAQEVIDAIGAAAQVAMMLLPPMPPFPDIGFSNQILAALNWLVPVGAILGAFAALVSAALVILAVRVILRWAKVL